MKIVKIILLSIVAFVLLILVAALFVTSEYSVVREVTINRSKPEVYDYVKYLKNQNEYSKWASMDPAMHKEFKGTDGTVGFVSAWKSEKDDVGQGEQEIKRIVDGERIDYEIRFIEPFASVAPSFMSLETVTPTETRVKWGFEGHMTYPTNVLILFVDMDKMIGEDLAVGLTNLKTILEK